ncbi:hypothetical protein KOR42_41930 [Thalassoglobus neptunius]|uniref:Uncharacterized protein n=1 Tax=Thalassoglobus neptunius TaxID=1938619 RepID=A0A5C5W8U6_9PLAN|nr:hypothetical protein KOR42_41930 [Thalassoglobus neptunius]
MANGESIVLESDRSATSEPDGLDCRRIAENEQHDLLPGPSPQIPNESEQAAQCRSAAIFMLKTFLLLAFPLKSYYPNAAV